MGYVGSSWLRWRPTSREHVTWFYQPTWLKGQEQVIASLFKGVPEHEKRMIVCENAAKLYHFA